MKALTNSFLMLAAVLAAGPATSAFAGSPLHHSRHGAHRHGCAGACSECVSCPRCFTCKLDVEAIEEGRSCWDVECEQICIPNVVFPWQKSCDPCRVLHNGAKIKTIKVLKEREYTCPACEYTWTPEEVPCCASGCCRDGHAGHAHGGGSCCYSADGDGELLGVPAAPQPAAAVPSAPQPPQGDAPGARTLHPQIHVAPTSLRRTALTRQPGAILEAYGKERHAIGLID